MFLFFAASRSIFPKPTAKLDIIFIESGKLLTTFSSILSVKELKIPLHPSLNSNNFFCEYISSFKFNFGVQSFDALSSFSLKSFLVIKIFFSYFV